MFNTEQSISTLVIDDELPVCMAVSGLLELQGISSVYALTAEEGIEYLRTNPQTDIVLLDIDLGAGRDGIELIPVLKEQFRYLQIVMLTSQERLDIGLECMKRGALDYMMKPFDEEAFKKIAINALEKKKLAQINDLYFDIIIHDLKNPLQCIVGVHEIIRERLKETLEPMYQKLFNTAEDATRQMQMMIGNILAVARFEKGTLAARREPFELIETIKHNLSIFQPLQIEFLIDKSYLLNSDKDLFLRVLNNLVANAIRFSQPNSPVIVKVGRFVNDQIQIEVTNTGSFIPLEHREDIFDKFASVYPSLSSLRNQNFGLGLTFCKMAVEAMEGNIWVESQEHPLKTSFFFTVKDYNGSI